MKLLISLTDLQNLRPLDLVQSRVEPYIQEAQVHDLRPVLGDELYRDFLSKFDQTGDPMYTAYQELLNGKDYTVNGYTITYYGVIPMLAYFTLARIVQNNHFNITRYGAMQKLNAQSEPISQGLINAQVTELRSLAINYQEMVVDFLKNNNTTYPLYLMEREVVNTSGLRFFDI